MRDAPPTLPGASASAAPPLAGRYAVVADLGHGGMAQVYRAWDERLQVHVALKVLHPGLAGDPGWVERFLDEARLLARLRHPGIPPVHDLERLDDGRPFYTMDEIRGRTLREAFADAVPRQRVGWVLRAAEIVAHAHALGVVHRDLSASNVLVGGGSDVHVVDWGLSVAAGATAAPRAGTPGFVAPEVDGALGASPAADVWALGGLLGWAVTGTPPHAEVTLVQDPELAALHARCRAPDPRDRPPDAAAVVAALQAWFDGRARRERAEAALERVTASDARAAAHEAEARRQREAGGSLLDAVLPHAPEADKHEGWGLEDAAVQHEALAEAERVRSEQTLLAALQDDPDNDRVHEALVARWAGRLATAERSGDEPSSARFATLVRGWRGGRYGARLDEPVPLTLDATPAAAVSAERYVERHRRLVAEPVGPLGRTPLEVALPPGSYRLRLTAADHHEVALPVVLERGRPWQHRGADGSPAPVALLPRGALAEGDCYVPAGWAGFGGDPSASEGLRRSERFVPGFVLRRHPVTVAEYLAYLDRCWAASGEAALSRVPLEVAGVSERGRPVFHRRDGRFEVHGDVLHTQWRADWPVTLVTWADAVAFAAAAGPGWRLPHDHEWEKAARGADDRVYPWGNTFDPSWANTVASRAGQPGPCAVGAFPVDESPYGVCGLAGNVRDWCSNGYRRSGPPPGPIAVEDEPDAEYRMIRGGAWSNAAGLCRLATRYAGRPDTRLLLLGFRLARSVEV